MYQNNGEKKTPYSKNKISSIITQFDSSSTPVKETKEETPTSNLSLLFEVIKEFNARLGDELDLKVGQRVQVISDDSEYNDGWYMGKNLETGKVGLYPKSFTQVVPMSANGASSLLSRPSLLRSRSRRLNSPTTSLQNSPITPSTQQFTPQPPQTSSLGQFNDSSYVDSSTESLTTRTPTGGNRNNSNTRHSSIHNTTIKDIDNALAELSSVNTEDFPADVSKWTPGQVSSYFSSIGVDMDTAGKFARHKITGAILLELELSHLKELDISSFGTRFEVFKAIEALKLESKNNESVTSLVPESGRPSLMPPPSVNRGLASTAPLNGLQRQESPSIDEMSEQKDISHITTPNIVQEPQLSNMSTPTMPETQQRSRQTPRSANQFKRQSFIYNKQQPVVEPFSPPLQRSTSKLVENLSSSSSNNSVQQHHFDDQQFMSPRKAPTPAESSTNSFTYRFGSGSTSNLNSDNGLSTQLSRLSTLPEGDRRESNTSRPTSSIYHSRSSSIPLVTMTSPTKTHKHSSSVSHNHKDKLAQLHKRHSSVFSFISGGGTINTGNDPYKLPSPKSPNKRNSLLGVLSSPSKISLMKRDNNISEASDGDLTRFSPSGSRQGSRHGSKHGTPRKSPVKEKFNSLTNRRSVSAQVTSPKQDLQPQKRATSESSRMKTLRNASSNHVQTLTGRSKSKTSLFKEGLQQITAEKAMKTADQHGWMYKKGSLNFKKRYFVLHGTRLSYYLSLKDPGERGLIDIQAHKVLPTDANDIKSMLLSSTSSAGRYSFKLIPPAPGSKKGLTFTQPKVHFFAVQTKEEMRQWMALLMKATIDLDDSVPVVSSYTSATISLKQLQLMQLISSERAMQFSKNGFPGDDNISSSSDTNNTSYETPKLQQQSRLSSRYTSRDVSSDYEENSQTLTTATDEDYDSGGFDSPYLLLSGLLSPRSPRSNHSEDLNSSTSHGLSHSGSLIKPQRTRTFGTNPVPMITNLENGTTSNSSPAAIAAANEALRKR